PLQRGCERTFSPVGGAASAPAVDDAALGHRQQDVAGALVAQQDQVGVGTGGQAALRRQPEGGGGVAGRGPGEVGPAPAGGGGEAAQRHVQREDAARQPAVGQPDGAATV